MIFQANLAKDMAGVYDSEWWWQQQVPQYVSSSVASFETEYSLKKLVPWNVYLYVYIHISIYRYILLKSQGRIHIPIIFLWVSNLIHLPHSISQCVHFAGGSKILALHYGCSNGWVTNREVVFLSANKSGIQLKYIT